MTTVPPAFTPYTPADWPSMEGLTPEQVATVTRQRERAEGMRERVDARMQGATFNTARASELFEQAAAEPSSTRRIPILLLAADAWAEQVKPYAACRDGCSHCCKIPLTITAAEAAHIAGRTGRKMAKVPPKKRLSTQKLLGGQLSVPDNRDGVSDCPFLADDRCSIYEDRPITCRTHMIADEDGTLCEYVPGHKFEIPIINSGWAAGSATFLTGSNYSADIRDFFPA